jgi:hypothetical protein
MRCVLPINILRSDGKSSDYSANSYEAVEVYFDRFFCSKMLRMKRVVEVPAENMQ